LYISCRRVLNTKEKNIYIEPQVPPRQGLDSPIQLFETGGNEDVGVSGEEIAIAA